MVLYPWPHFLPVNRRKSRSNSFSVFKRRISYWHSSIVVYPLFLGRPLRFGGSPTAKRACSRLCRLIQFLICTFSNPNVSAISCRVRPSSRIFIISASTALIFVHFRFPIQLPPDVVLLFSYIRGLLSIVRFYWSSSVKGVFHAYRWMVNRIPGRDFIGANA